jgi:cytoskeletal protein CcmA (bactofilin family)
MAFDGAGTFLRLYSWVVDATNSVKIRADRHDEEDNNFAAGLSQCITKDGQTAITQNIPFNSRRIVSLADPINPQDAATKDYADTKMPLDGSAPITGDVLIKQDDPTITLDGKDGFKNSIIGQKGDKNRWEIVLGNATLESGSNAGSDFQLINYADDGSLLGDVFFGTRSTGLMTVKADPTAVLGIATKQYADNASANKLPLAGGTITGNLAVNGTTTAKGALVVQGAGDIAGQLVVHGTLYGNGPTVTNALNVNGMLTATSHLSVDGELYAHRLQIWFGPAGTTGYISWVGGGNYDCGNGGRIWHSGNFNPTALLERIAALEAKLGG